MLEYMTNVANGDNIVTAKYYACFEPMQLMPNTIETSTLSTVMSATIGMMNT